MPEPGFRLSSTTTVTLLGRTALFSGLASRPVAELARHARFGEYAARQYIYQHSDPSEMLYFVVEGTVEVLVTGLGGGELVLTQVRPHDSFGELGLLDGLPRADSARAVTATRVLMLPRDSVLSLASAAPAVLRRLLGGLGATLRRIIDHASDDSFLDLHERIIRALLEIEARVARGAPAPTMEQLQQLLPGAVGAAPESVDEVLRSFEELGYLEAGRDRVRISGNRPQKGVLSGGMSWTALVNQVLHDPLTQLANRMLFHERLHQAVTDTHAADHQTAVLMIDLDGFKAINDTLGHAAGDALLVKVAERLRGCLRRPDTAARLGGDEFAAVITDVDGPETVARVADRVLTAVARPFLIDDEIVQVGASIGIALSTAADSGEPMALLGRADAAMYRAKRAGKRRWEMETASDHVAVEAGRELADRRSPAPPVSLSRRDAATHQPR